MVAARWLVGFFGQGADAGLPGLAHASASDKSPVAYKIHYAFYRYRVEKDHHF